MKILYLNVKKSYFDLIMSGFKTEDYREIKDHWKIRLIESRHPLKFKKYDAVQVKNGYQKNAPFGLFVYNNTNIRKPRPEWAPGFPCHKFTFAVGLGEKIESNC